MSPDARRFPYWEFVTSNRRIRGGSWNNYAAACTAAYRGSNYYPGNRNSSIGFRLARSSGN